MDSENLNRASLIINKQFKTFDDLEELNRILKELKPLQIAMQNLSLTNRMTLLRNFTLKKLPENEKLFSKGDPSTCIYVILHGSLTMYNHSSKDMTDMIAVNIQTKGSIIGERGILKNFPRSLTAIAAQDTYVLVLDAQVFKLLLGKEVEDNIQTKRKIIDQYIIGLSQYPSSQKERLAYLVEFENYNRGNVLVKQGCFTDKMMILIEGTCKLFQQQGHYQKIIAQLEKGSIIADESALFDKPCSYTATVASDTLRVARIRNIDIKSIYPSAVVQMLKNSFNARNITRHKLADFSHPCLTIKHAVSKSERDFSLASTRARETISQIRMRNPKTRHSIANEEFLRCAFKGKLQELRDSPVQRPLTRQKSVSSSINFYMYI